MPSPAPSRLVPPCPRTQIAIATLAVLLSSIVVADRLPAAIVYFPVNSGGSISQPGTGEQPVYLGFGDINIGSGTFALGTTFGSGTSFGIGLNAPDTSTASQFFSQSNNSIGWLISSGTIALLSAGTSVGSGTYTGSDPNFGSDWKAGVSPGYAGLQMTSGTDVYYGWASIAYVVDSPNQVTVNSFAFENQVNTPITAAAVPEPAVSGLAAGCGLVLAGLLVRRRRRTRNP